jgi:hypothetical protein
VQFSDPSAGGSVALRSATQQRAVRSAADCEFETLLPARQPALALAFAVGLALVAALLAFLAPESSGVAIARVIDPFGDHPWPPATRMTIQAPTRLASGDPFQLRGELSGVIPDRVEFRFVIDGAILTSLALAVTGDADAGAFNIRLEPNRVPRSFRYQVTANDTVTPWMNVAVLRAPELVPLDGRPSPQVHLDYPTYTRQPASDLPDGGGAIETIVGTKVTIRAAVDRPIRAAKLELADDSPVRWAAATLAIGVGDLLTAAARASTSAILAGGVSASLSGDGLQFELTAVPLMSARYNLRFEDAESLSGRRVLDVRLAADPSPNVQLERPAAGRESLSVLPDATIDVQARIDDPVFAIRSVWLEYRTAPDGVVRFIPLNNLRASPAPHAAATYRLDLKSLTMDRPFRSTDMSARREPMWPSL